jgi:hypothetical protein
MQTLPTGCTYRQRKVLAEVGEHVLVWQYGHLAEAYEVTSWELTTTHLPTLVSVAVETNLRGVTSLLTARRYHVIVSDKGQLDVMNLSFGADATSVKGDAAWRMLGCYRPLRWSRRRDQPSHSRPNTKQKAQLYLGALSRELGHPCEHGHYNCARWSDGPCSNELAHEFDLIQEG